MEGKPEMVSDKPVSDIIIGRLPIYLLCLQQMQQDGRQVTSSPELGERLGMSSAQIRKDLSQFGEFGKQGTGYNIPFLIDQLRKILKLDQVRDVAVVGAGDMGRAIAGYGGFADRGFRVAILFDNDPDKIGQHIQGFVVQDYAKLDEIIRDAGIRVAMIATPAKAAQEVAEKLTKAGVKAIVNYAPIALHLPEDVRVEYIDPLAHLQRMAYYL
jgi:redox-sensing transcriptional repressor